MPTLVRPEAGKKIILKYEESQQCGTLLSFSDDEFFVRVHGSTDSPREAPQDMVVTRRYLVQWSQDSGAVEEIEASLANIGYLPSEAPVAPNEARAEHHNPTLPTPSITTPEVGKKIILVYEDDEQLGVLLAFNDAEFFVRVLITEEEFLDPPQEFVVTRSYLVRWSQDEGSITDFEEDLVAFGAEAARIAAGISEHHSDPTPPAESDPPAPGKFIVIEGCDGSGTTTQARMLAERLGDTNSVVGHEPTGGVIGSIIRRALRHEIDFTWDAMALLFAADRIDHCRRVIAPLLVGGTHVICDRYWLSSLVYQTLTADFNEVPGVDSFGANKDVLEWVRSLNRRIIQPDVCFVLAVGDEGAAERRQKRGGKPELFEKAELQKRVAEAYACPAHYADYPFVLIDGEKSASEVHAAIWSHLRREGVVNA